MSATDLESFFSNLTGGFDPNQDPELALAVRLSLAVLFMFSLIFQEDFTMKPKADGDNYSLNLRMPDGKVQNWVFNKNSEVQVILGFFFTP
jgi:hypothetical protein